MWYQTTYGSQSLPENNHNKKRKCPEKIVLFQQIYMRIRAVRISVSKIISMNYNEKQIFVYQTKGTTPKSVTPLSISILSHCCFEFFFIQPINLITAWDFESKIAPIMDIASINDQYNMWRVSSQKCVIYSMAYYYYKCNKIQTKIQCQRRTTSKHHAGAIQLMAAASTINYGLF